MAYNRSLGNGGGETERMVPSESMVTKKARKTNRRSGFITPANIAPYISTIVPIWTDGDETSGSLSGNYYTFTGRRSDPEAELMYFRNRYYSPGLGRFVTRDPERETSLSPQAGDGYEDGMSLYAAYFVPQALDPTGQALCTCVGVWTAVGPGVACTAANVGKLVTRVGRVCAYLGPATGWRLQCYLAICDTTQCSATVAFRCTVTPAGFYWWVKVSTFVWVPCKY